MIHIENLPKPMTKEEQKELFENWNSDSWKMLAERNVRLALSVVNKFYNTGIEDEDLFGTAQIELVKAAQSFRPESGNKFATYATRVITNGILMEIRRNRNHPYPSTSLNEPIVFGYDGDTCELGELIACTKNPFEELDERQFLEYIRYILKNEDEKYQQIVLLAFDGLRKKDIAFKMGFSQSYISRILLKYKNKCLLYTEQR